MSKQVSVMGARLEEIVKTLKSVKQEKGRVTSYWNDFVKNPLNAYLCLWGKRAFLSLGKPQEEEDFSDPSGIYRERYFNNIRYHSKLRKIRDKISSLEHDYKATLQRLKETLMLEER